MKLLLITGAGASRNLGIEAPLPLMSDWADSLCAALDRRERSLASASCLSRGMSGPEFETNLGLLLRWGKVRFLEQRFQELGGPQAGSFSNEIVKSRQRMDRRMAGIMDTLHMTLFEEFGRRRISDAKAKSAFGQLLGILDHPELLVATTNYDGAGEIGLAALGFSVDRGFDGLPGQTPVLAPAGMVESREKKVPFIHLHGAVGWYENNGMVRDHNSDLDFIPSLGTPVVLYPDPEKDPTSEVLVSALWAEFEHAIDIADALLVVGHSLHDPALQRALESAARTKPVVVSYLEISDRNEMQSRFPGGTYVQMDFGPQPITNGSALLRAVKTGQAPAVIEASS